MGTAGSTDLKRALERQSIFRDGLLTQIPKAPDAASARIWPDSVICFARIVVPSEKENRYTLRDEDHGRRSLITGDLSPRRSIFKSLTHPNPRCLRSMS